MGNAFEFGTNGMVRRVYRLTLLPQKFRKENHHIMFLNSIKAFNENESRKKKKLNARSIRCNNDF
jgi:hypothetical protein